MPKKKKQYWTEIHEKAIVDYLNEEISLRERNKIFENIINPAFLNLVDGISQMPMFHTLYYIDRDQLKDFGYETLIRSITMFKPGRLGKNGYPVKAYSYYGTIVKHAMIFINKRSKKIGQLFVNDFDISYLSNKTYETIDFDEYIKEYLEKIDLLLTDNKNKIDDNMRSFILKIKDLLERWHELEFEKDSLQKEKLNLKEFKSILSKELMLDKLIISQKIKAFHNLILNYL